MGGESVLRSAGVSSRAFLILGLALACALLPAMALDVSRAGTLPTSITASTNCVAVAGWIFRVLPVHGNVACGLVGDLHEGTARTPHGDRFAQGFVRMVF